MINNGCIPFRCFNFRVQILCKLTPCHTVMVNWSTYKAIVNVLFLLYITSQNVCCEKDLLVLLQLLRLKKSYPYCFFKISETRQNITVGDLTKLTKQNKTC